MGTTFPYPHTGSWEGVRHHNHSRAFFSLLSRCQPDWQKRKDALARLRPS